MERSQQAFRNSGRTRSSLFSLALFLGAAFGGCGSDNLEVTKPYAVSSRATNASAASVGVAREDNETVFVDLTQTREIRLEAKGKPIDLSGILVHEGDGTRRSLAAILGQPSLPVQGEGSVRILIKDATPEQLTCGSTAAPTGCSEHRLDGDSTTERRCCILLGCNSRYCYWYCYNC